MSTRKTSPKKPSTKPSITEIQKNTFNIRSSIAYITMMGWIISYFFLSNSKTNNELFHIKQSFGLHMTLLACEIFAYFSLIPYFLLPFIWFLYIIAIIVYVIQSGSGKQSKIPFLGDKFQEWFSFL